jgi:probable F420-dependent oxidoreductase
MDYWVVVAFLEPDQLLAVGREAEQCGFAGIMVSDHMGHPRDITSRYPYSDDGTPMFSPETPWPDCWCTLSAIGAVTTHLRLGTCVYVPVARDLLTVAKSAGTTDVLSNGRVSMGVGVGWLREEFELTGQDFDSRGPRLTEMMSALRALWQPGWVEYHGTYYDVPPMQLAPAPARPIPLWVGGGSRAALRRAAELGDGWLAPGLFDLETAAQEASAMRQFVVDAGRDSKQFDILMGLKDPSDVDGAGRLADAGVTGIMCAPYLLADEDERSFTSALSRKLDALRRFGDEVISRQ